MHLYGENIEKSVPLNVFKTFLRHGQIWVPMHLYGENIEKSVPLNVFKTNS